MTAGDPRIPEYGALSMPDVAWERLRRQDEVIGPLAAMTAVTHHAADAAALELGLSRRQVYVLIARHRRGNGLLTDLAPGRSAGGRGGRRLQEPAEKVIREAIRKSYLKKQKPSLAALHRDIVRECKARRLPTPVRNTVARRVVKLPPLLVARGREGAEGAPVRCRLPAASSRRSPLLWGRCKSITR